MKLIKGAAAILALAVAGWCGIAPGIVGMRTEDKMRSDFAALGNSSAGALLSLQQFDRGWFSSSARAQLKLPLGGQQQVFQLDYHINQFPLPFVRWSRIDTTFTPLDAQGQAGQPLPLQLYTIRATDGSSTSHISGQDITLGSPAGTLTFSINGTTRTQQGQPVTYDLTLPGISYRAAASAAGGIALSMTNLKLNGSLAVFSTPDEPWASQLTQQFDSANLQSGSMPLAQLGPAHLDIALQDKAGNVDISYRTHLSSLKLTPPGLPPIQQDNIDADFSYNNLHKQTLTAWQTEALALNNRADLRANPAAMQQASMALVYKYMGGFLAQSPNFKLDRLSFHMPQGSFKANFAISFDGSGVKPADITLAWLAAQGQRRSTLQAGMTLERSLLDGLLPRNGGPGQTAQARASADAMLAQWQAQGLIKDDGKFISSSLQIDSSGIKANGQPLSLPAAMAGMSGAPAQTAPVAPITPVPAATPAPSAAPTIAPAPPSTPNPDQTVHSTPAGSRINPAPTEAAAPATNSQAAPANPAPAHHALPGPQRDLRHCLRLPSDRAIMRCAEG
jgi:uncharacterized protein YdgA (DUF945 family)